jgi:hypothetical protein
MHTSKAAAVAREREIDARERASRQFKITGQAGSANFSHIAKNEVVACVVSAILLLLKSLDIVGPLCAETKGLKGGTNQADSSEELGEPDGRIGDGLPGAARGTRDGRRANPVCQICSSSHDRPPRTTA